MHAGSAAVWPPPSEALNCPGCNVSEGLGQKGRKNNDTDPRD